MSIVVLFFFQLLFLTIILFLIHYIDSWKVRSIKENINSYEFYESVYNGGIEEPLAYRDLKKEEKELLEQEYRKAKKIINNKFVLIGVYILIIIISFVLIHFYFEDLYLLIRFQIAFFFSIIIVFIFIRNNSLFEEKLYRDLVLPVWKVQGYIIFQSYNAKRKKEDKSLFIVRKISFNLDIFNYKISPYGIVLKKSIKKQLDTIIDGDEICVEYSPFSKYVWNIEKITR